MVLFYNIQVNYHLTLFSFSTTFLLWSDNASKMKRFFLPKMLNHINFITQRHDCSLP